MKRLLTPQLERSSLNKHILFVPEGRYMTESPQFTVTLKYTNLVKRMWLGSREDDLLFLVVALWVTWSLLEGKRRNSLLGTS